MKHPFRDLNLVLVLLVTLVSLLAANRLTSYLLSFDSYSCKIDKVFSDSHRNEIITFLYDDKSLKNTSLQSIAHKIKENFPLVDSIIASQSASGVLHLKISATPPIFTINKDFVLVKNGLLFDRSLFCSETIEGFSALRYAAGAATQDERIFGTPVLPEAFKEMLSCLPKCCFDDYQVSWESETKSYLYDKSNKDFSILFNIESIPDEKIIVACQNLKRQLGMEGKFSCRSPRRWIADVRFKEQIVLFSRKRGGR